MEGKYHLNNHLTKNSSNLYKLYLEKEMYFDNDFVTNHIQPNKMY